MSATQKEILEMIETEIARARNAALKARRAGTPIANYVSIANVGVL